MNLLLDIFWQSKKDLLRFFNSRLLETYVKASLILSKHALSITWPQLGKIVFENFNRTTTSFVYLSESTTFPETKSTNKQFLVYID